MTRSHGGAAAAHAARYPVVSLVLQGGGALGSYQAGVYEGLAEAGIHPNWVAGISIGALNAAIICGNPPEERVGKLRAFWDHICRQPIWPPIEAGMSLPSFDRLPDAWRAWIDSIEAARALLEGQNGFFVPRPWFAMSQGSPGPERASFYDTRPLRATLEQFADFDRINRPELTRVSVGSVNVRNGNFVYFDNTQMVLKPEHFMASGALPPGFPAVEIDGELYWDGGLVSNTPLQHVLTSRPRRDALIFQIDLWSAVGKAPKDLFEVAVRQKDIQFSSRTRMITTVLHEDQNMRRLIGELLELIPEQRRREEAVVRAQHLACAARRNVIHLIYQDKPYESYHKDYQFGRLTMAEHWSTGLADLRATLQHESWLDLPAPQSPFVTHDLHRARRA